MTYVTKEYFKERQTNIINLEKSLEAVRKDKNAAYEGDTNSWHDNFAYESATREEKRLEDMLFSAMREMNNYQIYELSSKTSIPTFVDLYCWVIVLEQNIATMKEQQKTIGIVPKGAEDYKKLIYAYNAPIVAPLLNAKIGDVKTIKIPMGTFKMTILDIKRMKIR